VAVDASGNVFVSGQTDSTDFPTAGNIQGGLAGATDAFVTKLSASGAALVYSTYVGGASAETGAGVATDAAGAAFVTGTTQSTDFPVHQPLQATCGGCAAPQFTADAFVVKVNAAGTAFDFATYLGGRSEDRGNGIAVDAAGNAYVTGYTNSTDFPTTAGAFQATCRCTVGKTQNLFVAKIGEPPVVVTPPRVDRVTKLARPFRLQITGALFAPGVRVFIGSDAEPWPMVELGGDTLLTLGSGRTLKTRFPKGVAVPIRVVNPDGGEAVSSFAR
jgi:hypothetical protein